MRSLIDRRGRRRPGSAFATGLAGACLGLVLVLLNSTPAQATPAFARQTGSACSDCHAAAYGPALTPYGMRFKINGFTDTDGNGGKIPVAVQLIESRSVPARGQIRTRLSEADLYLAGRVNDHIGGFAKVVAAHSSGRNTYNTTLSNVDIRYVAKDVKVGSKTATFGVSVNNSPGFDDPLQILPDASALGPAFAYPYSGTLLNQSNLNNRVVGAGVYGFYDTQWYGEIGTYSSLPTSAQHHLGYNINNDPGKLKDTTYARFAYMKDLHKQFFSAGLVAFDTRRRLPRSGPSDHFTDLGYDLSYQWLGTRQHIVQASYSNIYEKRRYGSLQPLVAVSPGVLGRRHGNIRDQTLSVTYIFRQSYGVTLSHLINTGSADPARYSPYNVPDTTANSYTVFWTPFGRDDSYTYLANLKIAANWFRFTRFNGSVNNLFGTLPPVTRAKDLDQFTLSASLAF